MQNSADKLLDDPDDFTQFEIAVVNKQNKALVTDCVIKSGEIYFDQMFIVQDDASEFVKGIWLDKKLKVKNKFYNQARCPKFMYLSENLQNSIIEYLYGVGIRPEIGICLEYLSWNKEQRLYMQWLRDLYLHLFPEDKSSPSSN